jgi:predicted RND superfamily exporter protein
MNDAPTPRASTGANARGWDERVARFVAGFSSNRRRAAATVFSALLISMLAAWWGVGVRIDTDLKALLPPSAPSARAMAELRARKGTTELFTIAIEEEDVYERERMFEELVEMLRSWPETLEVYAARDYTVIRDHTLYFLETEDLDELRRTLLRERQRAVARSMSATGGANAPPPEAVVVGEDDWDSWDQEPASDPDDAATSADQDSPAKGDVDLRRWIRDQRGALVDAGALTERELGLIWPEEDATGVLQWRDEVVDPYLSKDKTVQVLKASLSIPPTDVTFAHELNARMRGRVAELQRYGVAPDARVEVVASYNVTRDIDTILEDAKRATWISALAVVGVLLVGFRRLRGLVLVIVPIGVATTLTLAVTRASLGTLNALTLFLFAVLFGMGVDFAVHLYAQRRRSESTWETILGEQLRPLLSSMLTTAGSLAVLSFAEFKALREFGGLSASGVAIAFVCAIILVPALDVLIGPSRGRALGASGRGIRISGAARGILLAGLAAFAALGAPRADFERDLSQLTVEPRGNKQIRYGSATGRCGASIVLVAEDADGLEASYQALERERDAGGLLREGATRRGQPRPWVRAVYTVQHSLPAEQQEKHALLQSIHEQAGGFLAELDEDDPDSVAVLSHLEALERLSAAAPLVPTDLPQWAAEPFTERDGRMDRIGHLCPTLRGRHLDELVALKNRLNELLPSDVQAADSRLVFGDLVGHMQIDSRRLPLMALGVIALLIGLDLRRLGATMACFGALALGVGFTVGLMGLLPLRVNFFNLVVMPSVIGLSIDTSIHLWYARSKRSLGATARASAISALTTVAGFSGLLIARHPGLRSIGELGVVAIIGCVGVAFLTLYPSRRD